METKLLQQLMRCPSTPPPIAVATILAVFTVTASPRFGVKKSSAMQKKLQRLSRNVSKAISSIKNSLYLDSASDSATASLDGHPAMLIQEVSNRSLKVAKSDVKKRESPAEGRNFPIGSQHIVSFFNYNKVDFVACLAR
ncbi:hypothetical protein ACFX2C_007275 [Malus domestica]